MVLRKVNRPQKFDVSSDSAWGLSFRRVTLRTIATLSFVIATPDRSLDDNIIVLIPAMKDRHGESCE